MSVGNHRVSLTKVLWDRGGDGGSGGSSMISRVQGIGRDILGYYPFQPGGIYTQDIGHL